MENCHLYLIENTCSLLFAESVAEGLKLAFGLPTFWNEFIGWLFRSLNFIWKERNQSIWVSVGSNRMGELNFTAKADPWESALWSKLAAVVYFCFLSFFLYLYLFSSQFLLLLPNQWLQLIVSINMTIVIRFSLADSLYNLGKLHPFFGLFCYNQ